jgi:hypothetical protein
LYTHDGQTAQYKHCLQPSASVKQNKRQVQIT